ncbi:tetratricopeptide repeat protein [Bdellovibrio sp. HCB337]|uniref:tetratricopeptide repeat protein n=1 Tax=Bdellovibrio sp. HCB337 TaxID=3394358 RepID=UPI0039A70B6D
MKTNKLLLTLITASVSVGTAHAQTKTYTKSSKVPAYRLVQKNKRVNDIPRLNIGDEREIVANIKPLSIPEAGQVNLNPISRKQSPPLLQFNFDMTKVAPVTNAKAVTNSKAIQNVPDLKVLNEIQDPVLDNVEAKPELAAIVEMKPNDYKMLQALIFLEYQKNYELAFGLFSELMEDPEYRTESWFNYALTAKGLGLNSEFRMGMIKVATDTKSKEWQERAVQKLIENVNILKVSDVKYVDPLITKYDIDTTQNETYQMYRAKYYLEAGQLGQVEDALIFIGDKSPNYPEATMISALSLYRQGKVDDAIITLNKLMEMTENDRKGTIRNVAGLTLGRMYFQKGAYKDSFQAYLKVDKTNPMWLQAMTEQAWTQIMAEDYEGAAGNMFSLHTDFFKNAFVPESYTVRTVGYLNLCQYGDGIQVLTDMKKKFTPLKTKLATYQTANEKRPAAYYETVKAWLKNSDRKEVDGLPRPFIVELARHPSFTVPQTEINSYEDEIARFNKVTMTLIAREKTVMKKAGEAGREISEIRKKLIDDKNSESLKASLATAEKRQMSFKIQQFIAQKARTSIKKLREMGIARMEKEKSDLREQAGTALKSRMTQLAGGLNRVLEQNEVLAYELYSGAGEHIRYQMAGGDISEKERPELKVEKAKSLNWNFQGEIWEDEVGHYRSSLKNVCPQEDKVTSLENN